MSRIFAVLIAVFMFAAGCGSGGEGERREGEDARMFPPAMPDCTSVGRVFPFPGGTSCPEGLEFSRQDLETTNPGEYWENCGIDGESRSYAFDDGTGFDDIVRGSLALGDGEIAEFVEKRLNFTWTLDTETCSLRVTYDRSLCGTVFEYRVADVSEGSITLEAADPNNPSEILRAPCALRQASSSE